MHRLSLAFSLFVLLAAPLHLMAAPVFNRAPLARTDYASLPLGSIHPKGWLLDQLERQRDGMTGHLDDLYPAVVGDNNAWLGGDGDTWERGPYWIDGLLPLAWLLDDPGLKAKALRWVEAILSSVTPDGYFGNTTDRPSLMGLQRDNARDWWPRMVALKILQQYYMATEDPRVIELMTGYFRYQAAHLGEEPLDRWTFWGKWRGGDNLDVVLWLYNLTGDESLLPLADLLHAQTEDFTGMFWSGDPFHREDAVHCVNLAQGFKEPVVWWQRSHEERHLLAPEAAWDEIRTTIGLPTGLWAGDELTHWGEPTRGSEFCTAAEMMFSLETMLRISGRIRWADHLERVAYNALPTQATDSFDARQYYQQTNQIACTRQIRNFVTEHDGTDNVFGILNGYPCCTCNMHQAWPKFTQNLWYATLDGGLAALVYAPCTVGTTLPDGTAVTVDEQTDYPFGDCIRLTVGFPSRKVKAAAFPLHLRIPQWCREPRVRVNGSEVPLAAVDGIVHLVRSWQRGDVVEIELPMKLEVTYWYDRAKVIERGPLVYALKMEETWTKKAFGEEDGGRYGEWYYEVTSTSPWNYALSGKEMGEHPFTIEERGVKGYPWNVGNAPVVIRGRALRLPRWQPYGGSAGPVTYHSQGWNDIGELEEIELIPYGCTTLRIAEFPGRR